MLIKTRYFGEVEIAEDRIITFEKGMPGFTDSRRFTLLHDSEKETNIIFWLQSLDDAELAFPVMDPMSIRSEYNPVVEDELLVPLGEVDDESDYYLLSVVTVPKDITKMTANLKAPVIINTRTMKAAQIIVDNADYEVRFNVFDYIKKCKEGN